MLEVRQDKGVLVSNGVTVRVDPEGKSEADYTIISHAHSDHLQLPGKKSQGKFVFSSPTYSLLEEKLKSREKALALPFKKKIQGKNFSFSLRNSGHVLGSAQAFFESSQTGQTVGVTSDFKLQDSLIQEKAEILSCDILVIESTFGLPEYVFPPREQVYKEVAVWVKEETERNHFLVLGGYSLGKAQELTKILNEFNGVTPLVYDKVFDFNEKYRKQGIKLDYLKLDFNLHDSNVLILPPHLIDFPLLDFLRLTLKKKIVSAMATGWDYRGFFNKTFKLSDHADFSQLIEYVKGAEPKLVLTVHGFEQQFANYVQRKLGIPAKPLNQYKQKRLLEF